jgi:hypothetical protein
MVTAQWNATLLCLNTLPLDATNWICLVSTWLNVTKRSTGMKVLAYLIVSRALTNLQRFEHCFVWAWFHGVWRATWVRRSESLRASADSLSSSLRTHFIHLCPAILPTTPTAGMLENFFWCAWLHTRRTVKHTDGTLATGPSDINPSNRHPDYGSVRWKHHLCPDGEYGTSV